MMCGGTGIRGSSVTRVCWLPGGGRVVRLAGHTRPEDVIGSASAGPGHDPNVVLQSIHSSEVIGSVLAEPGQEPNAALQSTHSSEVNGSASAEPLQVPNVVLQSTHLSEVICIVPAQDEQGATAALQTSGPSSNESTLTCLPPLSDADIGSVSAASAACMLCGQKWRIPRVSGATEHGLVLCVLCARIQKITRVLASDRLGRLTRTEWQSVADECDSIYQQWMYCLKGE